MTQRIFVDRSRYETFGRCPRSRYLEYHFGGQGITSARRPLPLAVGSSVHEGLATLLRAGQAAIDKWGSVAVVQRETWMNAEEDAVRVALADFAEYQNQLDLPDAENAIASVTATGAMDAHQQFEKIRNEFDEYLFAEQSALVEAMVRAYARRRLLPLLEQFEVLEVEREGEWKLSEWTQHEDYLRVKCESCGYLGSPFQCSDEESYNFVVCPKCNRTAHYYSAQDNYELWFMSRPDALLRERESNQLYLLSFKTTGSWDIRKARDAEHDMQGMSEGVEIERRLGEWHGIVHRAFADLAYVDSHDGPEAAQRQVDDAQRYCDQNISLSMRKYLRLCAGPPRILAVRYEYMLKGERWKDKELSERFGVEMRSQKSHLIRAYVAVSVPMRGSAGYNIGDRCWSWDYIRDDGKESSLAWQNWKSRAVFEAVTGGAHIHGGVREWIDSLDDAAPTMSADDPAMGLEPRLLGYACDAQSLGVTAQHPLDAIFIPPIVVYRNEDELRDLVDQLEATERRIAEGVAEVSSAVDAGELRHAMNVHFPQTRRACSYPVECQFTKICYGGADIRSDPVSSGLYRIRVANHPQENQA